MMANTVQYIYFALVGPTSTLNSLMFCKNNKCNSVHIKIIKHFLTRMYINIHIHGTFTQYQTDIFSPFRFRLFVKILSLLLRFLLLLASFLSDSS